MRRLESIQTPYNDVDVWENWDGSIDFNVIGATHATWHPTRLMTGHAWDAITAAILLHPEEHHHLLMLGLGGGTVLRQLRHFLPDISITAVEIDPEMIGLARRHMELDLLDVDVIEADAFDFLANNPNRYDVVVDDLYRCGDNDVERPAAVTEAMLAGHALHLVPGGSVVMNFVVGRGHHLLHRAARKAFLTHFPSVRAVRPPHSHNEVLIGTTSALPLRGPGALRSFQANFVDEKDQKYWKELRNLKLR
ncbi:MAG: fused MFS/spermidine synthase [Kiritimatiellae bacterium]|jgi:spermidine synthase|nr:fused MFS/spermidine synthase [Kiritimatiellia bacterium]